MATQPKTKAKCLAVMGTGSDVGKSVVVTALCRYFADQGLRVAPFKAQNMSNNSGVTPEGLEMGRAQIVQAEAARIAPNVDMNPVLLKPTSDVGAQMVLLGIAQGNYPAGAYHEKKTQLFQTACNALNRMRDRNDLVILEGAGSCAEVNLMAHDIVNLRMAEYAQAPVILVGDIHRGGIFAQLVGTLSCLSDAQVRSIAGFIINRFRGDIRLFKDGVRWVEGKTRKPVLGVLPWYSHIFIDPEDSVVIENPGIVAPHAVRSPAIGVIRIPHISNFTDFDPLSQIPELNLYFLEKPQHLKMFRAVILPGSKNTRYDLQWLMACGWHQKIQHYIDNGGHVLGICGGYQMLGKRVDDPTGIEGCPGTTAGLDLLPVHTVLEAPKTTTLTRFTWGETTGMGYEIHMGRTHGIKATHLFDVQTRNGENVDDQEGCVDKAGRVMGTYIHGLFENPGVARKWLRAVGLKPEEMTIANIGGPAAKDRQYDLLAQHFAEHVDMKKISALLA